MVSSPPVNHPIETYEVDNALVARTCQHGLAEQRTPLIVGPAALDVVGRRVIIQGRIVHRHWPPEELHGL